MRKIYTSLLVLMLMMVSTTVKAQYEATIAANPTNDWVAGQQSFAATDIATALGLADAAALKELINSSTKTEEGIDGPFYIKTADGKSNQYTGNANEFWMDDEGLPHEYSGASWFVGVEFEDADSEGNDSGADRVNIYVGQMPQTFTKKYEPSSLKTTVYLVNGGKEVSFAVTQNIAAATEATIKVETTKLSELTFVKDYAVTLPFNVGEYYEGKTVTATLDGIYEALGVANPADLDGFIDERDAGIYGQVVSTENDETILVDELQPSRVPTDGWFGRHTLWDEATATETVLPVNMLHDFGGGCTFYIQNVKLADGEFSFTTGQYPDGLKVDDTDSGCLYIIVGKKAVRIIAQVEMTGSTVDPGEDIPFDQCTKAGESTVKVVEVARKDYETKNFTVDIADITAKLGCEADAFATHYRWCAEGVAVSYQETNDGYTGADGYAGTSAGYTWANMAPIFVQPVALADGKFKVGQRAGIYATGEDSITSNVVINTSILYKYSDKYYEVKLEYTIQPYGTEIEVVDPGVNPDDEFDIVATLPITMQIIPSSNYYAGESEEVQQQMQYDLGLDKIKELIGEGSYEFYGLKAPANADVYPELTTSTGYTPNAGFNGGFWMGMPIEKLGTEYVNTSFSSNWGTNAYGIEWQLNAGVLGFDQIPDQRQVGDFFVSTFYWVNTNTNQAIKYELSVVYVDEIVPQAEVVEVVEDKEAIAEEKIEKIGGSEFYDVTIDIAKVAAALGVTEAQFGDVQMLYAQSMGVWATINPGESSQYFGTNGYEDLENGVEASVSEEYVVTLTLDDVELGADDKITLRYAFDYNDKRVLYTIVLGAPGSADAIADVKMAKADGAWYTLSGVKVAQPTTKGAYIHNGKKVYLK